MKKMSTAVSKQGRKFSQPTLTIALDLGDRNSWYCVLDVAGQIDLEQRIQSVIKGHFCAVLRQTLRAKLAAV